MKLFLATHRHYMLFYYSICTLAHAQLSLGKLFSFSFLSFHLFLNINGIIETSAHTLTHTLTHTNVKSHWRRENSPIHPPIFFFFFQKASSFFHKIFFFMKKSEISSEYLKLLDLKAF